MDDLIEEDGLDAAHWAPSSTLSLPPEEKEALEGQFDLLMQDADGFPWFVSITTKKQHRRLHIMSSPSCPSIPGVNVHAFELVESLEGVSYDSFCKRCWRKGATPIVVAVKPEEGTDEPSNESSSDDGP